MGLESIASLRSWALKRAKSKIAQKGLVGTVRWALGQAVVMPRRYLSRRRAHRRELAFDQAHGVDTSGIVNPPLLAMQAGYSIDAYAYQGCDPDVIASALGHLPIRFSDYAFVDLGSGKGRALMSVRKLGFRKIVGVEFSPVLCDVARRNLERLTEKDADYPQWEIICADAATFKPPAGPNVLMLYNPFGPEIMRQVIERVKGRSDLYVLYFNPTLAGMWEKGGFRTLHREADYKIFCAA